jgi:hypothetical protein
MNQPTPHTVAASDAATVDEQQTVIVSSHVKVVDRLTSQTLLSKRGS